MASMTALLCTGTWMTLWSLTTGDGSVPTAQNVRWVSLDFKTTLTWTVEESEHTYTVLYSAGSDQDWVEAPDCSETTESECDLTQQLLPPDRTYSADIRTHSDSLHEDYGSDYDFPHTFTPDFNPYRESNISAVEFSLEDVDKSTVIVNIKPPLTTIAERGKRQTVKDILKDDLKYKISYYKSGSTGKREKIYDTSEAKVSGLDAGERYCFMVAAFIPSRPKANQHGAWSSQQCIRDDAHFPQDLSLGAWVGIVFILITVLIILITATLLCCRRKHQRHKNLQTSQSSVPV